jgi:gamma-glutamylcyclotransferase (GGCT)/AIG2-like uncharacterized protein YtfP
MLFAVNGTLMRGLHLNKNMLDAGAVFIEELGTAPVYRLWSINDEYPGMVRVSSGGRKVLLELWEVPSDAFVQLLNKEPPGLSIGKVLLEDGREVLGVIAETYIVEGKKEITLYGGWKSYIER